MEVLYQSKVVFTVCCGHLRSRLYAVTAFGNPKFGFLAIFAKSSTPNWKTGLHSKAAHHFRAGPAGYILLSCATGRGASQLSGVLFLSYPFEKRRLRLFYGWELETEGVKSPWSKSHFVPQLSRLAFSPASSTCKMRISIVIHLWGLLGLRSNAWAGTNKPWKYVLVGGILLRLHLPSRFLLSLLVLFFFFLQASFDQHRLGQTSYERPSYLPASHPPGMMLRQKSIGETRPGEREREREVDTMLRLKNSGRAQISLLFCRERSPG